MYCSSVSWLAVWIDTFIYGTKIIATWFCILLKQRLAPPLSCVLLISLSNSGLQFSSFVTELILIKTLSLWRHGTAVWLEGKDTENFPHSSIEYSRTFQNIPEQHEGRGGAGRAWGEQEARPLHRQRELGRRAEGGGGDDWPPQLLLHQDWGGGQECKGLHVAVQGNHRHRELYALTNERTNSDLPGQETGRGAPAGEGEEEPQHEDRGQVQGEGHRAAMLPCLPLGTDGDRSPPPPQRPSHPLPARHGIQPEVPGGRGNRKRT